MELDMYAIWNHFFSQLLASSSILLHIFTNLKIFKRKIHLMTIFNHGFSFFGLQKSFFI